MLELELFYLNSSFASIRVFQKMYFPPNKTQLNIGEIF